MHDLPITLGITRGEPTGIGPEILEKALKSPLLPTNCTLKIIGKKASFPLSKPTIQSAHYALNALNEGANLLKQGMIDGIVTCPICKENLHQVGFSFPGQTEFFASKLGIKNYAMCLTGPHLTVGLVTIHQALSEVPSLLQKSEIIRIGLLLSDFCQQKGLLSPRIAVCGLNPHAGENGAFGTEESRIIQPAIKSLQLKQPSTQWSGPHSPDTIFAPAAAGQYDAVLCMYHDQGLIPLKLLDFDKAVNVTLGLPLPRTSPDHGTAFDIAGQSIASPDSLIAAIQLAATLARHAKSLTLSP